MVVKVTCGAEAPERCSQGLTVAATAAASGASVSLWLTGEATWLAVQGHQPFSLPHATPPADLLTAILGAGTVTVCAQCAARRELSEAELRPGARIAGAASYVMEVLEDGAQALVY